MKLQISVIKKNSFFLFKIIYKNKFDSFILRIIMILIILFAFLDIINFANVLILVLRNEINSSPFPRIKFYLSIDL